MLLINKVTCLIFPRTFGCERVVDSLRTNDS
jgi:hypothetical protein